MQPFTYILSNHVLHSSLLFWSLFEVAFVGTLFWELPSSEVFGKMSTYCSSHLFVIIVKTIFRIRVSSGRIVIFWYLQLMFDLPDCPVTLKILIGLIPRKTQRIFLRKFPHLAITRRVCRLIVVAKLLLQF